jgi:tetratricopeptide (TPR) repeat protein
VGLLLAVAFAASGSYFGLQEYRVWRLADSVRRSFAARRYEEARVPLQRWLDRRPRSAEAQYYRGWLALADDRPREVEQAVERAWRLGFDRSRLVILRAIYQARAGGVNAAEPTLRRAFEEGQEPRAEVAAELARIDLATYRLDQAAEAVERYRELMPTDPQPYLWSNEIGARSGATPAVLIRHYRAALERDPNLDRARIGLAEQLSNERRFDEADVEYRAHLRRNPRDTKALVGLGRNAFQMGRLEEATRDFEAALVVDPRQVVAIKELAHLDVRSGRFAQARRRLELLTQIEPFDHELRYSYAQALEFAGETDEARIEAERASQLRKDQEQFVLLRSKIQKDPGDLVSKFQLVRWMLTHGHGDEGLKLAREILRADPRHSPTHRALADYFAQHGDPGLANYHRTMASSSQDAR